MGPWLGWAPTAAPQGDPVASLPWVVSSPQEPAPARQPVLQLEKHRRAPQAPHSGWAVISQ